MKVLILPAILCIVASMEILKVKPGVYEENLGQVALVLLWWQEQQQFILR